MSCWSWLSPGRRGEGGRKVETFDAQVKEDRGKGKEQHRPGTGVDAHDWGPPATHDGFFLSTSSLTLVCTLFDDSLSDR